MSTKEEAVRGLICAVGDLGIICICQQLYEGVLLYLVLRVVILKAGEGCLVLSLGLTASLRVKRRSGAAFSSNQCVELCKELAGELCSVIGEEIHRNAIWYEPMVTE